MIGAISSSILMIHRAAKLVSRNTVYLNKLRKFAKQFRSDMNSKNDPTLLTHEYLLKNDFWQISKALSIKRISDLHFIIDDSTIFPNEKARQNLIYGSIRFAIRYLATRGLPTNEKTFNFSGADSLKGILKIFPLTMPHPTVRIEIFKT